MALLLFFHYTAAPCFFFPFFKICRMEVLPLSLFIVFDRRHLGHKQQVNQTKQQVIINDSCDRELWLCVLLLYSRKTENYEQPVSAAGTSVL